MKARLAKRICSVAVAAAVLGALSGCATTADDPKDPYEGFNRAMFSVNEGIDVVAKTQSAVVLEKLISQFMFNKASEGSDKQ